MKTERIVLSFIAVLIGILVAGAGFYFYQSAKAIPSSQIKKISLSPKDQVRPTPPPATYLSVDSPKDEDVVDSKTITISGKTAPDAIVVVSTKATDNVITPAANGNFSTSATIDDGVNEIQLTAIAPNGEETKITRIVTYSTETF